MTSEVHRAGVIESQPQVLLGGRTVLTAESQTRLGIGPSYEMTSEVHMGLDFNSQ